MHTLTRRVRAAALVAIALIGLSSMSACSQLHTTDVRLNQPRLSGADVRSIVRAGLTDVSGYHCTVTTAPKTPGSDYQVTATNLSAAGPEGGSYEWVEDYLSHTVTSYWVQGRAYRESESGAFGVYPANYVDPRVTADRFGWIANNLTFLVVKHRDGATLTASSGHDVNGEALLKAVLLDPYPSASQQQRVNELRDSIEVTATIRLDGDGHVAAQSLTVDRVPQALEDLVLLDRRETCGSYNRVEPIRAPSNTLPEAEVPSGDSRA